MRITRSTLARLRPGGRRVRTVLRQIEALPLADIRHLTEERPVLFLAPHPDDESLGCGGAIAAAIGAAQDVHVLILTDGAASHPDSPSYPADRLAALRADEARAAVGALGLGAERIGFLGQPDGAAGRDGEAAQATAQNLIDYARTHAIQTICTTWRHDPHPDHQAACRFGQQAARALGIRLLQFPVWGWLLAPERWIVAPRVAGFRLDITPFLEAKRKAIAAHRSQTTNLITDSPAGFTVPTDLLAAHDRPFEAYLEIG